MRIINNNSNFDYFIFQKIKKYCEYYDIPIYNLVEIISDLKVIPMIRGKGFEFTVSNILSDILPKDKWSISNPNINAQSEIHDVDVIVMRNIDEKKIRIECKLSGKDSFRIQEGLPKFKVKCMRSRTISDNEMATRMAQKYGVDRELVINHPDQYREGDFDFERISDLISRSSARYLTVETAKGNNGLRDFIKDIGKIREFMIR